MKLSKRTLNFISKARKSKLIEYDAELHKELEDIPYAENIKEFKFIKPYYFSQKYLAMVCTSIASMNPSELREMMEDNEISILWKMVGNAFVRVYQSGNIKEIAVLLDMVSNTDKQQIRNQIDNVEKKIEETQFGVVFIEGKTVGEKELVESQIELKKRTEAAFKEED